MVNPYVAYEAHTESTYFSRKYYIGLDKALVNDPETVVSVKQFLHNYTDSKPIELAGLRTSFVNNYDTVRIEIWNSRDNPAYQVPREFLGPNVGKYEQER